MSKHIYTAAQRIFIKDNVKGRTTIELAELMSKEFGIVFTPSQMKGYMSNHKLTNGVNTMFKKGMIPFNKGKKFPGQVNSGCFKKGHIPENYRPIGSERVDSKDGYVLIKVSNEGTYKERWKAKHRELWEAEFGKLETGEVLLFLDGNKQNIALENLMKVTQREMATLNKLQLLRSDDPESKKAAVLSIRLQNVVSDKEKRKKKSG